jgi:glutaminyl-tRNA synthetase
MTVLEDCLREDLNERAPRATAVLDPLKLVIDNYPAGDVEAMEVPVHPQKPELGRRKLPFGRELWIEREDFAAAPPKGYFRLYPGNTVRLRYAYLVKCTGFDQDASGNVTAVRCEYVPDSRSGTPGADQYKAKGNIHWVAASHAYAAEVRLYDRLFAVPFPGSRKGRGAVQAATRAVHARHAEPVDEEGKAHAAEVAEDHDWLDDINPNAKKVITAYLEPGLKDAKPEDRFQFERHGYFVADLRDSKPGKPVFNRAVTLRDSWAKQHPG